MSDFNHEKFKCEFKDFIGIYENAFTSKECVDAIKSFETYHDFGYTYCRGVLDDKNTLFASDDISVNINPQIELSWDNGFIKTFHERFYECIYPSYNIQYPILQNLNKHRAKHIKIQKTFPTRGYHVWHCEHNPHESNRILSWILYLNDVEEGGETEFLYQSMRIKPKAGTCILFPAYFTHTHRGNPPLSGVKYIATGWVEFLHTTEIQGKSQFPNPSLNKSKTKNQSFNYI